VSAVPDARHAVLNGAGAAALDAVFLAALALAGAAAGATVRASHCGHQDHERGHDSQLKTEAHSQSSLRSH